MVDGEILRGLRGKRSREVVAHELRKLGHGTDAKAIWRYETGRSQPSSRVLSDYAHVLGAESVDALMGREAASSDDEESRAVPLSADEFRMLGDLMSRLGASFNADEPARERSAA